MEYLGYVIAAVSVVLTIAYNMRQLQQFKNDEAAWRATVTIKIEVLEKLLKNIQDSSEVQKKTYKEDFKEFVTENKMHLEKVNIAIMSFSAQVKEWEIREAVGRNK